MKIDIIVPKAGLTMKEAQIAAWLVREGQNVKKDEAIAELTTEKMTVEVLAPEDGILSSILKPEGDEVKVGETLAVLSANTETPFKEVNMNQPDSVSKCNKLSEYNNDSEFFDVAVIGGGPGGYVAAIRAAQLGGKVVLIERDTLGGVCLNSGCIPTKTLLKGAELVKLHGVSKEFGILYSKPEIDYSILNTKKDAIIQQLLKGISYLLNKNNITLLKGFGKVISPNHVVIEDSNGNHQTINSKNIILATGSKPSLPPIPGLKEANPLTNKEALALKKLPESIAIIGGGAIGCEFAGIYAPLGVKVVLIESEDEILTGFDKDLSKYLKRSLKKDGVEILTSAKVMEIKSESNGKTLYVEHKQSLKDIAVKEILVAAGRKSVVQNLKEIGLEVGDGAIKVDEYLQTNIDSIYAIGDMTGIDRLAHVASAQGVAAAENCMGHKKKMNYQHVPRCIYTSPEIASVGLTEKEAQEKGYEIQVGKYSFNSNGRALTNGSSEGFVKIIREKKYNQILGVHIIGKHASELISEAVLALNLEATPEEFAITIHPHPTLSEGLYEAALASIDKGIHL